MSEYRVNLTMKPVPEVFARVYRRRRIPIPELSSPHDPAALVPYAFRKFHELHARANGYFWLPCDVCSRAYGGHEIGAGIPDPERGPGAGKTICPSCAASMYGGQP